MQRPKVGIAQRLTAAGVAIHNALVDGQIGKLLATFGYDTAKLEEGQRLLDAAQGAVQAQVATAGGWQTATSQLAAEEQEARAAFHALAQVARAAYGGRSPMLVTLGLNQPAPLRQGHFLTMATALFDNALSDTEIAATLAGFGYTTLRLLDEKAKIGAMDAALQAREAAKGSAQQATMDQIAALGALDSWMSAFKRVAKVALRGQEQLLEKLGILARNAKTVAQRQGPLKAARTRRVNRERLKVVARKEDNAQAVA